MELVELCVLVVGADQPAVGVELVGGLDQELSPQRIAVISPGVEIDEGDTGVREAGLETADDRRLADAPGPEEAIVGGGAASSTIDSRASV
jgi:hypothetical protein